MNKNKIIFFSTFSVIIVFYILVKWLAIDGYKSYNGKILHMSGTSIPVIIGNHYRHGTKNYPYIEYYVDNDTLNTTNKGWNPFLLEAGDEITVFVNSDDEKDIKLYTFFNYWLHTSTVILFVFLFFIGLGFTTLSFKDFTEE